MTFLISGGTQLKDTDKNLRILDHDDQNLYHILGDQYHVAYFLTCLGADVSLVIDMKDARDCVLIHHFEIQGSNQRLIKPEAMELMSGKCDDMMASADIVIPANTYDALSLINLAKAHTKLICINAQDVFDIYGFGYTYLAHVDVLFLHHKHIKEDHNAIINHLVKTYDINIVVLVKADGELLYYTKQTEIIRVIKPIDLMPDTTRMKQGLFASFLYFFLKGHPVEQSLRHALYAIRLIAEIPDSIQPYITELDVIKKIKEDAENGLY